MPSGKTATTCTVKDSPTESCSTPATFIVNGFEVETMVRLKDTPRRLTVADPEAVQEARSAAPTDVEGSE